MTEFRASTVEVGDQNGKKRNQQLKVVTNIFCPQHQSPISMLSKSRFSFTMDNSNHSRRFLYFNDDFAFSAPVSLSDFWTEQNGYKIYR